MNIDSLKNKIGLWEAWVQKTCKQSGEKELRRNPPDVGVTSGQKSCTKIIYIVLQTSVGLF